MPSILILVAALAVPQPACAGEVVVERVAPVMGTTLRVRVWGGTRACALAAGEAALAEVERQDGLLSSWRADSELARVNGGAVGAPVAVDPELGRWLAEAGRWVVETGGAFDPAVGALVDAWGLRGSGRAPSESELAVARAATGWVPVSGRGDGFTLTRPSAAWWLDTGGFGKGAALRAAGAVLRRHGVERAVLDFGGQLVVLGGPERVAVAHPSRRSEAFADLVVGGVSVATTSASERFVEVGGQRLGHVLDPRTGRPVAAWGSVTVVAEDPLAADAVSTALFVMGPDAALAWAASHPEIGVLVLEERDGVVEARCSASMERWLTARPGGSGGRFTEGGR